MTRRSRAFVRLRELLASNSALARKLDEFERKYKHHDEAITAILSAIRELTHPPAALMQTAAARLSCTSEISAPDRSGIAAPTAPLWRARA